MLYGILIVIQVLISVLLVVVILMQAAKGGGLAGIAGGLTSSPVFGGRGAATFLSRATTTLAVLFMLNCLGLAVLSKSATTPRSVTQSESVQPMSPVPTPGEEALQTEPGAVPSDEGAIDVTPAAGETPTEGKTQPTPSSTGGSSP